MRRRPGSTTPRRRSSRPASVEDTHGGWTAASSPGKVILLGEHAVVFGQPALAVAVDLRAEVRCRPTRGGETLNGRPLEASAWPYVHAAAATAEGAHEFLVESGLQPMGGMGSSAAVTVATLAALHPRWHPATLATDAYAVELGVQGRASPIDTSTATHGSGIFVDGHRGPGYLWTIEGPTARWHVHHVELPPLEIVVANTGIRPPTGPLVARVRELVESNPGARGDVERIGEISREGLMALSKGDWEGLGVLMLEDHKLLNGLGVGHPLLDKFVQASMVHSYGAKLTGAGGGGNMVALPREVEPLVKALEALGGRVLRLRLPARGVEVLGRKR